MSEWIFEQVAGPFGFTEGPLWIGEGLLFTDMPGDRVLHYDPQPGQCTDCFVDGPGRRIVRYESDGSTTVICDHCEGHRFNSPNDLVVDGQGRIWFTDPRYGDARYV